MDQPATTCAYFFKTLNQIHTSLGNHSSVLHNENLSTISWYCSQYKSMMKVDTVLPRHMETCILEELFTVLNIWQQKRMFWQHLLSVQVALPELLYSHLQRHKTNVSQSRYENKHTHTSQKILECYYTFPWTYYWVTGRSMGLDSQSKSPLVMSPMEYLLHSPVHIGLYHCQERHNNISAQYRKKSCSPWDFSSPASDTLPLQS
jgi:hypothetical protein